MELNIFLRQSSHIVSGFPIPDIIGRIDNKISGIDIVSFDGSLEQFGVMHCPIGPEVQLLVLS